MGLWEELDSSSANPTWMHTNGADELHTNTYNSSLLHSAVFHTSDFTLRCRGQRYLTNHDSLLTSKTPIPLQEAPYQKKMALKIGISVLYLWSVKPSNVAYFG